MYCRKGSLVGARPGLRERLEKRIINKPEEGCWEVRGYAQRSGHKQIWHKGRMQLVHRMAWELENGPIPEGRCVLHTCDNPPCVRPDHLFLGTVADNNKDRDDKGRQAALRGEQHGSTKITDKQVEAVRLLAEADVPQHLIAQAVGITQSHVSNIHRKEFR